MENLDKKAFHFLLVGSGEIINSLGLIISKKSDCTIYSKSGNPSMAQFKNPVTGIIILVTPDCYHIRKSQIIHFKNTFYSVPTIAIISNKDINLAHLCGKIGIDKVFDLNNILGLEDLVISVVNSCNSEVKLCEFKIDMGTSSIIIRRALTFIEKYYTELMGVTEIADYLGITESTLSREFKRNNLIGPKKVLLYFKTRHAIKLMTNTNYQLKIVSQLSGFTNEKRLIESFNKLFFLSPNEYRKKNFKEVGRDELEINSIC